MEVGENYRISSQCIFQASGGITIGDNCLFGPGARVWSINHGFLNSSMLIKDQGYNTKKVVIGNDVWLGTNAIVLPGANIPDGVVISAGSVVSGSKKMIPYTVYAGHPLRKVKERK